MLRREEGTLTGMYCFERAAQKRSEEVAALRMNFYINDGMAPLWRDFNNNVGGGRITRDFDVGIGKDTRETHYLMCSLYSKAQSAL